MQTHSRPRASLAVIVGGALSLFALAAPAAPTASAAEAIHVGISNRSLLGLPIIVAKEKGFFEAEGLDVTVDYFAGGVPATAALLGGSVQFIDAAFENNLKTVKKKQPIVSVMAIQADFAGALVLRKDLADKLGRKPTVEDLKGLRLGTLARGGFADVSTRYFLNEVGLKPDVDVELVPVKGADRQLTAGEAGEIDAAFVMEPWSAIAVETTNKWAYITNITLGEGPDVFQGLGYATLQTTRDYVAEHRPTVEKTIRAVTKAQAYIADPANLGDIAEIANREYGEPGVEVMHLSLERQLKSYTPALTPTMVEKTAALLLSSEGIEAPAPAFADVVDDSFAPLWTIGSGG